LAVLEHAYGIFHQILHKRSHHTSGTQKFFHNNEILIEIIKSPRDEIKLESH
jgi:hypothetical protein